MSRYINKYTNQSAIQDALDNGELLKPYVAYIEEGDTIDWNSKNKDYSNKYLTFKITSAGTINVPTGTTYSIDGGEWENTGTTLSVNGGESIRFKGNNEIYKNNTFAGSTAGFNLEGNVMSLIYGDNFIGQESFPSGSNNNFYALFQNCTGLTSAENLILPATTLADYCYTSMFNGCTNLATAPALPATTLANYCYSFMFSGCTSLATAPTLPATTLAQSCYQQMFNGCTSLTTAPDLSATTLANYCYFSMFNRCSSLNYIKCLATDISASQCTNSWVRGVASTGTFDKASSMTGWSTGNSGIPSGWTVVEV